MPRKLFNKNKTRISKFLNALIFPIAGTALLFWFGFIAYTGVAAVHNAFYFIAFSWSLPLAVGFTVFAIALSALYFCEIKFPIPDVPNSSDLTDKDEIVEHVTVTVTGPDLLMHGEKPNLLTPLVVTRVNTDQTIMVHSGDNPATVFRAAQTKKVHFKDQKNDATKSNPQSLYSVKHKRNPTDGVIQESLTPPGEIRLDVDADVTTPLIPGAQS